MVRLILLLVAIQVVFGCSSGGNSSGAVGADSPNLGLGGADLGIAIYNAASSIKLINLATSASTEIKLDYTVWPSLDEKEWISYDTERRYDAEEEDDFIFFDQNGKPTSKFPVKKSLHGIPKLSPDRKLIAAFWANEAQGEKYTEPSITIFDRTGRIIIRNSEITDFNWFPDGRMILAIGNKIYSVDSEFKTLSFIRTMNAAVSGLSVSPDGQRLAFAIEGVANNERHVWVMNADGSNPRQLTTSNMNEMNPVWVGNSSWLLVRQGVSSSIQGPNGCPDLYLVDSSASSIVELSYKESAFVKKVKYRDVDSASSTLYDACPFSSVAWISGK